MGQRTTPAVASAVCLCLCAPAAQAATITSDLTFTASSSLFGGAPLSDFQVGPGSFGIRNIAEVRYQAKASAGTVDARVLTRLQATHPESLAYAAAAATPVDLSVLDIPIDLPDPLPDIVVPGSRGSFSTAFGVEADVEVVLFGAADLRLLDIDGMLETSAAAFEPFNDSIRAEDEARIARAGNIVNILGARFGARASLFTTQESELTFGNLIGTVRATHEDGTMVSGAFALDHADSVLLDLRRTGVWALELTGITVEGYFSSDFGFRIGGRACVVVCGDISSGILPFGSAGFDLPFSEGSVALSTVTVLPDMGIVPLPAGFPLLAGGLAALALFRRRPPAA